VVALGVDLPLLRQAVRVLRLKQVDADPVVEQPARNHVHMSSGEVEEVESKHRIKLIRSSNSNFIYIYIYHAPSKLKEPGRRMGTNPSTSV
jgi:hypothetical protein